MGFLRIARIVRLGPVAADVALGVDVGGGGRPAGAVEVVGDRLAAPALVGPEVEDLRDHRGLVGSGTSRVLTSPAFGAGGDGVGAALEPVAVGGRPPQRKPCSAVWRMPRLVSRESFARSYSSKACCSAIISPPSAVDGSPAPTA